jgi:cbb3-type cytochrome oxidase subunit 3
MARKHFLRAAFCVAIASISIGCFWSTESNRKNRDRGEQSILDIPDPEAPAVHEFIDRAINARMNGDIEALKACCAAGLATRINNLQPQPISYEIRRIEVLTNSAEVVVWTMNPELPAEDNQSLVTFELQRAGDTWKVADVEMKTYFGDA